MSETMIDRVARADAEFCSRDFDAMGAADKRRFRDRAAYIIKAMRAPTIDMIDAACGGWAQLYPGFPGEKPQPKAGDVVETVYRAMIDAAQNPVQS